MQISVFLISFCGLAALLTYGLRRYAIKKDILDIPNERSSHSLSTPRGGGVSIVVCFLLGTLLLGLTGQLSLVFSLLICIAGLIVAGIGWIDDKGHVKARWRLMAHFLCAAIILFACQGLPAIGFFSWSLDLGTMGNLLALVWLVWMLNLFNFMDGIDGIAGSQAVVNCLVIGGILFLVYDHPAAAYWHWLMSVSALGFLLFNYPPAKIFMGDAGSGFTGLMLAGLLLYSANIDSQLFWVSMIMQGVFIVDASFTLFIRLLNGQKIYQAHSSHCYQRAARQFKSHKVVTQAAIMINLLWLAPIAIAVSLQWLAGALGLFIGYVPLLFITWYFKAGNNEN